MDKPLVISKKQALIIIKLGGSVITLKDKSTPKIRTAVVKRLAKEIRQILDEEKYQLIIIHGVGSFGHPLAKQHNLVDGMKSDEQKLGYCLMEESDLNLHYNIIRILTESKVPSISLSPHSFIKTSNKVFGGFDLQIIKGYLKLGLIPVLFGDGIYDDEQGCSILSGDITMAYLSERLKAHKVIFLSDVDGVFTADPKKDPKAQLIPEINDQNLNDVLKGLTANNPHDVSGEMKGKVLEIKKQLQGVSVNIISGLKKGALIEVVAGHSIGTRLLFH